MHKTFTEKHIHNPTKKKKNKPNPYKPTNKCVRH